MGMWTLKLRWPVLLLAIVLAGCSKGGVQRLATAGGPVVSVNPESVVLLDIDGASKSPQDLKKGVSPFGVVITPAGNYCGVAHVAATVGSTSGHCASDPNAVIRYFSRTQQKLVTEAIVSVLYRGDESKDDTAFIQLSETAAQEWDVVGKDFLSQLKKIETTADSQSVVVWGYEKSDNSHLDEGQVGIALAPRVCSLSPRIPRVGVPNRLGPGYSVKDFRASNKTLVAGEHFFLDNCSGPMRQGRSGDLVTSFDLETVYGVLNWIMPREKFSSKEFYWGSLSMWQRGWDLAQGAQDGIFSVGTSLGSVIAQHPELKTHFK